MKVTALPEIIVWLQQNNMSVELSYSPREGGRGGDEGGQADVHSAI